MRSWNTLENQEHDVTSAALRELPPEQELEALRLRVAQLEYRIVEKSIEADALREIGQAIGSMSTTDDILRRVADIVVKVTGTDLCLIYLLNVSGTELVLRAASGSTEDVVGKIRLKVGEGITGWVAQQGQHVVLSKEAWRDERFKPVPNLRQDKYQSMLSVPLRGRKGLVGVINVRTNRPQDYTRMEISLLDSIARQVGGVVENYNDYDRMERRATQLNTLSEISHTITSDMYLEEILQLIVSATAESMNFKICSVMFLNEDKSELVIKATQSKSRDYIRKPNVKLNESVAGRAVTEGKPIVVRDVRKTPGYQYPDIAKKEGLCSLIALPLSVKKEIIGVLNCYTAYPHDFTDEETGVLTALANQAAISIQNAKLMVRTAVLQEMHHRVKNSLQTIASLLRLQMRMGKFDDPKDALNQSINRIMSIAAVHEMLSSDNLDNVNIKKLADQMLSANARAMLPDTKEVKITVEGEDFLLPSGHAIYVALILNELIQNAVEHGLKGDVGHELAVKVSRDDEFIVLDVINDGEPLPENFDFRRDRNLGLRIVDSLVRDNLMGEFNMASENGKTRSWVRFHN